MLLGPANEPCLLFCTCQYPSSWFLHSMQCCTQITKTKCTTLVSIHSCARMCNRPLMSECCPCQPQPQGKSACWHSNHFIPMMTWCTCMHQWHCTIGFGFTCQHVVACIVLPGLSTASLQAKSKHTRGNCLHRLDLFTHVAFSLYLQAFKPTPTLVYAGDARQGM